MLSIDFITAFPEMTLQAVGHSILARAARAGLVSFGAVDPRTFTHDAHRTIDDKPYGGGPGMLMKLEPVFDALSSKNYITQDSGASIILTDPTGALFTQKDAIRLSKRERIAFVCGHYEGIDHRIQSLATDVFSIGDFVLTGGELPSLVMADAIVRLLPGALGCGDSLEIDSHSGGLLSAPQFTRPESFHGEVVPEVLRSGNHEAVERWKRKQALESTRARRPDLFCRAKLEKRDLDLLSS